MGDAWSAKPVAPGGRRPLAALTLNVSGWVTVVGGVVWMVWVYIDVGMPRDGAEAIGIIVSLPITGFPVAMGILQIALARRFIGDNKPGGAFAALVVLFFIAYVTAWESQWFEARRSFGSIGVTPPASWNDGRIIASSIVAIYGMAGISVFLPARWRTYPKGSHVVVLIWTVVLTIGIAGSVPVLRSREDDRAARARDACRSTLRSRGADQEEVAARCHGHPVPGR